VRVKERSAASSSEVPHTPHFLLNPMLVIGIHRILEFLEGAALDEPPYSSSTATNLFDRLAKALLTCGLCL
jgi:hypothetical protein